MNLARSFGTLELPKVLATGGNMWTTLEYKHEAQVSESDSRPRDSLARASCLYERTTQTSASY